MTLQSMTGFASAAGQGSFGGREFGWTWELRSVNSKGLDIRLRLPPGAESLEAEARRLVQESFARGAISATLSLDARGGTAVPMLNRAVLDAVIAAAAAVRERIGGPPASVASLLGVKGVLETAANDLDATAIAARDAAILETLRGALQALAKARRSEGKAIAAVLAERLHEIEALLGAISANPARTPEAIRANLRESVAALLETGIALDEGRLLQEAALLAVKSDIREELDRLAAHLGAARKLVAEAGPVGRKLDFLAQEFNRECNTICSKSNAATITALGLDMKIVIDQLREQVQNVQ